MQPQTQDTRVPSMAIEAEQLCLGACIISRAAVRDVQSIVKQSDFYRSTHQQLFSVLCQMDERMNGNGEEFDLRSIATECERSGFLEILGGPAYIAGLIDMTPTAANVSYHAGKVHETALVRKSEEIALRVHQACQDPNITPAALAQMLDEMKSKLDEKPRPAWAFWREVEDKHRTYIEFDTLKYLDFISENLGYKVFFRRDVPCIVSETSDSFEYCIQRGQQVISVKNEVVGFLKLNGFYRVASEMLNKPRLFHIDTLENLPEISRERVKNSVFAKGETRVRLQDEYIGGDPVWIYQENPDDKPRVLLNRHDIGMIVAKTGKGKTTSLELLVSIGLYPPCGQESPFKIAIQSDEIIFHQDSEQSHDDNLAMLRRIAKRTHAKANGLLDETGEFRQHVLEMCADDVDDINLWLLEKIDDTKQKIGLLIIDTLLDSTEDMNEQRLSMQFFRDVKRIARVRNCAVLVTCHASDNSSDDDGKAMGHLGSLFARKCKVVLQVSNDATNKDIKLLSTNFKKAKARRAADYGMTAAFTFVDGMPDWTFYTPPDSEGVSKKAKDIEANLQHVLQDKALTKPMLISAYKKFVGCTDKTARNHYESARASGFLTNERGKVCITGRLS